MQPITKEWTLFLDRDGVINKERSGSYILRWEDFIWTEGALEGLGLLSRLFGRILVVTNQRCIGMGLISEAELEAMHRNMIREISRAGGRIDAVYYCGDLDRESPGRKPRPSMALRAKKDFPDIDFHRSVLIGNNTSDLQFGKNLGMFTIFIPSTGDPSSEDLPLIDLLSQSLWQAARVLETTDRPSEQAPGPGFAGPMSGTEPNPG